MSKIYLTFNILFIIIIWGIMFTSNFNTLKYNNLLNRCVSISRSSPKDLEIKGYFPLLAPDYSLLNNYINTIQNYLKLNYDENDPFYILYRAGYQNMKDVINNMREGATFDDDTYLFLYNEYLETRP